MAPQPSQLCDEAAEYIEELRKDMRFQARVINRHYDQFKELHKEIEDLRNSYFLLKQWKELAIEFALAACYSTASNQLEEFRRQRCLAIWNMLTELDADNV
jgi:hypothetical protein